MGCRWLSLLSVLFICVSHITAQTFKTSITICKTSHGSTTGRPTVTRSTISSTITLTRTTHPVVTETEWPLTSTVVRTELSTTTYTYENPPTAYTTVTSTVTSTRTTLAPAVLASTTTTTTVTTTSATSTITYSLTVTAIQSTFTGATSLRKKKRQLLSSPTLSTRQRQSPNPAFGLQRASGPPRSISCVVIIRAIVIITVPGPGPTRTVTYTVPPTATITSISTSLIWSTVTATDSAATLTQLVTTTSTKTVTPTIATTETYTSTIIAAVATVYPQCDAANRANSINGQAFLDLRRTGGPSDVVTTNADAKDPVACCISCLLEPACGATFFTVENVCLFLSTTQPDYCRPVGPLYYQVIVDKNILGGGATASNGKCGQFYSVNDYNDIS